MDLQKLFKAVTKALSGRKEILTEDNVRFILFAEMLKQDSVLEHYILEQPYELLLNTSPKKKIELDLYYKNGDEKICFEIKFHQNGEGKSTYPHTMSAGQLFNDVKRLKLLKGTGEEQRKCILFYITDDEMFEYLSNISKSQQEYRQLLKAFFDGKSTCKIYESRCPKTFNDYANQSSTGPNGIYSLNVDRLFYECVQSNCYSLKKNSSTQIARCYCYAFEVK